MRTPSGQVYVSPRRLIFVGPKRDFASFRRLLTMWPPQTTLHAALQQLRGDLLAMGGR